MSETRLDKEITIALVEDEPTVREDEVTLLRHTPGVTLVEVYRSGEEALVGIPHTEAQVVLMDILMPGKNGIECTRELKAHLPETHVIMLTGHRHGLAVWQALDAKASGFILKPLKQATLLEALAAAQAGQFFVSPEMRQVRADKLSQFLHPAWILPRRFTDHALRLVLRHDKAPDLWFRLAQAANFEPREFARRYGRSLGQTERDCRVLWGMRLGEWLRCLRMAQVALWLYEGQPFSEIACRLKQAPSNLGRDFKRAYGCTPTEFRRLARESDAGEGDKAWMPWRKMISQLAKFDKSHSPDSGESNKNAPANLLTEHQLELAELLAKGLDNKTIATELGIKENTVRTELKTVYRKLGVHSRTAAIIKILQLQKLSG
jgi:DNA-binding NarL/FixJ family response regulator